MVCATKSRAQQEVTPCQNTDFKKTFLRKHFYETFLCNIVLTRQGI